MAITMQGAWTVTVKSKNAGFDQRFIISRPGTPDIVVSGVPGNSAFVTAPQWSVNFQSRAGAGQPWIDSAQRITFPSVSGGLLRFNINTDDPAATRTTTILSLHAACLCLHQNSWSMARPGHIPVSAGIPATRGTT